MKRHRNTYAPAPLMEYVFHLSYFQMPGIWPRRRGR
jgi:hypothetical protein